MSKFKGPMTAQELMAQLEKDPQYLRRKAEKDEKFRLLEEMYAELARPTLESLRSHGFEAASIQDLVRKHAPLPRVVVGILLKALATCENDRMCESLVRALGAAEESFDGRLLVDKYDHTRDEGLKFAVLNTIAVAPAKPHSIDAWLDKARQNPHLRAILTSLGYKW